MEIFIGLLILIGIIAKGFHVINQFERGVILTLGKYTGTKKPGLIWLVPVFQKLLRVDLRITTLDIPKQEVITKDNVPVYVNGVVYFLVEKPENAILGVQNYAYAISQYAQAALRDGIGRIELDTLLAEREEVANNIERLVEQEISGWGIKVISIKMQDIELPADMKRIMARQAEAERERRAVIIQAEGELTASENLRKAAINLTSIPGGLSLRALTTIEKSDKATIFAVPFEIFEGFKGLVQKRDTDKV